MKITSHICSLLAVNTLLLCAQSPHSATNTPPLRTSSALSLAHESFFATGTSGSIILTGKCVTSPSGLVVSTEELAIPNPMAIKRIDDDLDNLSHLSSHYGWLRRKDGLVQFRDDRASAELLRLHLAQFELVQAVNLEDAVDKLLKAQQVVSFLKEHHIDLEPVFTGASFGNEEQIQSLSKSPTTSKYSLKLTDVTLEEALNSIVRTFPGVWIYCECPGRVNLTSEPVGFPHPPNNGSR
jgi:hypothetical protein